MSPTCCAPSASLRHRRARQRRSCRRGPTRSAATPSVLELNRGVDCGGGLLFEERIEPVVAGYQAKAHGAHTRRCSQLPRNGADAISRSVLVDLDALCIPGAEQLEHLAGAGMPTGAVLRVQGLTVNDHVEDPLRTGDQAKLVDDVLVVPQEVVGGAHGALGIVSRNAIGDRDLVLAHPTTLRMVPVTTTGGR